MGLFEFFKSKEERFRIHVRACFDESVKNVIKEKGDAVKHPLFGGMMIQTGQSENSVVILLSGYSFVSLRHETMASITDSIS